MSPQIEFGLELIFRRPDLYSTAKLRWTFFTLRALDVCGDVSATSSVSQHALQISTTAPPV